MPTAHHLPALHSNLVEVVQHHIAQLQRGSRLLSGVLESIEKDQSTSSRIELMRQAFPLLNELSALLERGMKLERLILADIGAT